MMFARIGCVMLATALSQALSTLPVRAQGPSFDDRIVYIECVTTTGSISRGTGVLVSEKGDVLTAKHVVPSGSNCRGGLNTATKTPDRVLIRGTVPLPVDAILLRFVRTTNEKFKFFSSVRLEDSLKGTEIVAAGFPRSGVGDIFITAGIISQINVDEHGVFGTSALQSSGMSGGPVVLKDSGILVGIIVGATFDAATGSPASYGVLAIQEIGPTIDLQVDPVAPQRAIVIDPGRPERYEAQYEGLLRGAINALAQGVCSETMSVLLRTQCESQMPGFGNAIKRRGPILSTKFAGLQPSPMGPAEVYTVTFKDGRSIWMVNTTPDGKLLVFWAAS